MGSMTTPLPIRFCKPGRNIPEGDRVEDELLTVKNQGVPSVGAALKTGDDVVLRGENVNDLAFAFVSPLETE